eukprot:scaffold13465_cov20-Tisochrysis_lutea.AAC.5
MSMQDVEQGCGDGTTCEEGVLFGWEPAWGQVSMGESGSTSRSVLMKPLTSIVLLEASTSHHTRPGRHPEVGATSLQFLMVSHIPVPQHQKSMVI